MRWFRDYAAYCGLTSTGKQLYAVVSQIAVRKPLLVKKLAPWDAAVQHEGPACSAATWQREPLSVTFQANGLTPVAFDLVGSSAVLLEGDADAPEAAPTDKSP